MYEFYATDRQGNVWRVVTFEALTRQDGTCRVFEFYPTDFFAAPLLYVRYKAAEYWKFNYSNHRTVERVSMRHFFPGWDLRKIHKEWRCI